MCFIANSTVQSEQYSNRETQISVDGAITPIPYSIDFFSIQMAIGSRIGKQGLFSCCPSSGISMPDIFKYLVQGGGGGGV